MINTKLAIIIFIILLYSVEIFSIFFPQKLSIEQYKNNPTRTNIYSSSNFTRLVEGYGYPAEEHKVWTIDGYKLRIHRIPGSPIWPQASGKPVVFIQHGILASSDMFVLAGPDKDLGNIILSWLTLDTMFGWEIHEETHTLNRTLDYLLCFILCCSFHEIALYDLSSMIDYVLHETNQPSVVYVAHSMGTTEGLILLSSKPEYNKKIHLVINLATISNWKKPRNFMKFLKEYGEYIKTALIAGGFTEVLPQTLVNYGISHGICRDGNIFQQICIGVVQFISGYNSELLDNELLANGLAYFPAGTSRQTLFHFHQNMIAGKLQMYDYGFIQNFALYKQFTPPAYNLENIVTRVIMFYGNGDAVATPEDTLDLLSILKNAEAQRVPHENFSHLDFVWAKNIKSLLQNRILEFIKKSGYSNIL